MLFPKVLGDDLGSYTHPHSRRLVVARGDMIVSDNKPNVIQLPIVIQHAMPPSS